MKKKFEDEQCPESLEKLQHLLKRNKGGDGWFVGDDVSNIHINNKKSGAIDQLSLSVMCSCVIPIL